LTSLDLVALDATALAQMVRSGEVTSRAVVEATLRRIDELDSTVNAFRIVTGEDALAAADRIDALADADRSRLPLAGVPVAIKDDTDVAGQSTAWGSRADRGRCERDSEVVARLRTAGAVIVGKTNVPELTLWPWTASEQWGVTRNPWNLERTPGGSSGGSAAAVCTGMAALALGSDGGGSIRYPAGLTGLVGLKPQRGRLPVGAEHASGWHGLLVLGPLARSVRDAALLLDVAGDGDATFRRAVDGTSRRLRIAVSTNVPPGTQVTLSSRTRSAVDSASALLAELGHDLTETDVPYGLASLWSSTVRLLKGAQQDVASLPDRDRLEARTRSVARLGRAIPNRSLARVLGREPRLAASINRVFDSADVVLTPLCASPAPRIDDCPSRGALRSLRASNTSAWLVPWNVTGQPAVSVPIGVTDEGLPAAVQLVGRPDDEATLLGVAAQLEAARPFPRWTGLP
jgi:amidase